jgi:hypothetical protein
MLVVPENATDEEGQKAIDAHLDKYIGCVAIMLASYIAPSTRLAGLKTAEPIPTRQAPEFLE